jgi:cytochrome P450
MSYCRAGSSKSQRTKKMSKCRLVLLYLSEKIEQNELGTRPDLVPVQRTSEQTHMIDSLMPLFFRTARVKDTGRKLSDKEIRAIALEVLLAGSDTVATTIAMAGKLHHVSIG